jgi:thioredoxin 1
VSLIEVTDDSFREVYKNNDMVVLDFWAVWCGPCQNFIPIFEEVSKDFDDVVFGKVNTDLNPNLSNYFSIRSIPTVLIIRDQLEVFRGSGMSEKDLRALVKEVKEADMNEVRKKLGVEEEI